MPLERSVFVAALALASCTHEPPAPDKVPTPPAVMVHADNVTNAMSFFQHLQGLSPEELKVEYARVANKYVASPTPDTRIQLILLLSYPRADFRDLDAALRLIDNYLVDAGPGALTDLVSLLGTNLRTQQAYEERIRAAEVRSNQLQQQLNALKSIERALHAREMPE